MAPSKNAKYELARHKANVSWSSWRSVNAPPKRISELTEESPSTEVFTPIPVQHEREGPALGVKAVCLSHFSSKHLR
jgi:hypothetical protein